MLKTERQARPAQNDMHSVDIGIEALQFIASDPVQFHRFLALSGLDVAQLREASRSPNFFAGLLDFVLAHEPTLLAFAKAANLSPGRVVEARKALSPCFEEVPE